jgi:hypothetical protein
MEWDRFSHLKRLPRNLKTSKNVMAALEAAIQGKNAIVAGVFWMAGSRPAME